MTVLVLDGNENQAVAAVRGLAAAGHRVAVGAATRWSKAGWSRDCAARFRYAPPDADADRFIASIADALTHAGPGTLVLPMTEATTLPISASRAAIARLGGRIVLPPHETVLRAFDKAQTTALARALGVDVPGTATITGGADVDAAAASLRFPLVLKPRSSQEMYAGSVRTTGGPVYARDVRELRSAWAELSTRCSAALAQEFVQGSGSGYFALMRDGELRAEFAHRRIRDVRPTGSGSAVRESIVPPPALREAALAILKALRWHGVAMVEFRVRRDGTPTFLEVNGRFWNSLALAIHAGVNFPALLASLAENGDAAGPSSYRAGIQCRWLLGDVRHLAEVWRGAPEGYPGRFPGRFATLAAILRPTRGMYHDNFSWRDPWPAAGDWLHFALRKLPRHAGRAPAGKVWHAARRPSHP
jgi:predicted ATP-grasp superfamily ATP-dependent carboligase